MNAIRSADPAVLTGAAERLRGAMRNRSPSQRRRRLGPQPSVNNLGVQVHLRGSFSGANGGISQGALRSPSRYHVAV
jgi:hypothetical protein